MSKKGLRDILCACVIILMLPCSAYIIRAMSVPYGAVAGVPQDSLSVQADPVPSSDSATLPDTVLKDSLAVPDTLARPDSLSIPDSSAFLDSLSLSDSLAAEDSLTVSDSMVTDTVKVLTKRELKRMAKDSARQVKNA